MTLDSDQLSTLSLTYSDSNAQPTYVLPPRTPEFDQASASLKAFSTMTGIWLNYADKVNKNYFLERLPTEGQLTGIAAKITRVLREKKAEYVTLQSKVPQDFIQSALLTRQIKQLEAVRRRIDTYFQSAVARREHSHTSAVNDHETLAIATSHYNKGIRVPLRAPSLAPSIGNMRSHANDNAVEGTTSSLADAAPLASQIQTLKTLFEELRDEVRTLLKDQSVVQENDWPPFDIIHVNSNKGDELDGKYAVTESAATRPSRREQHRKSLTSSSDSCLREHKPSSFHRHPSVGTSSSAWMKGYLNTEPPCLKIEQEIGKRYTTTQRSNALMNETNSLSTMGRKSGHSLHESISYPKKGLNKEADTTLYNEHVTGADTFKNEPHMPVALPRVKRSVLCGEGKTYGWTNLSRGASSMELERDLSTENSNASNSNSS